MLRFDKEEDYDELREFLQSLAPREAWCNTELSTHGTDFFCPFCSRYIEGKEYWGIDTFHFDTECRYCHATLVHDRRKMDTQHYSPCTDQIRDNKGRLRQWVIE